MEGSGAFPGGEVFAKVTLSRGIGRGLKRGHADKDKTYTDYADNKDKTLVGTQLPPVTLHLILTNTGALPVTVSIFDFDSDLGNFAVNPDHLTIPPGRAPNRRPSSRSSASTSGPRPLPGGARARLSRRQGVRDGAGQGHPHEILRPTARREVAALAADQHAHPAVLARELQGDDGPPCPRGFRFRPARRACA